jgi:hypothetical protein
MFSCHSYNQLTLLVTTSVVPSSPILVTLMKEALNSYETSVLTRAAQRNIPEDAIPHILTKAQNPILINKYTDWDYFSYLLETNIDLNVPLKTIDQIEDKLYYFTTVIQEAEWKSTPNLKRKLRGLNFTKEIREMIAEKRKFRSRWHQTRAP